MLDGEGRLRIIDFGLATEARTENSTSSALSTLKQCRGNGFYVSPEMRNKRAVTCQHDMWALGLVLCEMLIGKLIHDYLPDGDIGYSKNVDRNYVKPRGIARLVKEAKAKDANLGAIADKLLTDCTRRLSPAGVTEELHGIRRNLLGARVVRTELDVTCPQAWVDDFRQKPVGSLSTILRQLKPGGKRLITSNQERALKSGRTKRRRSGQQLTDDEAAALKLYTGDGAFLGGVPWGGPITWSIIIILN